MKTIQTSLGKLRLRTRKEFIRDEDMQSQMEQSDWAASDAKDWQKCKKTMCENIPHGFVALETESDGLESDLAVAIMHRCRPKRVVLAHAFGQELVHLTCDGQEIFEFGDMCWVYLVPEWLVKDAATRLAAKIEVPA